LSADVEIHLIAYDEASSVIEGVGSNLSVTFSDIEGKTQELVSTTDKATSQIASDYGQVENAASSLQAQQEASQASFGNSVMAMNNLALAGAGLVMSFERIENAQVMVDRANLMVQRSTETAERAQTAYNDAVSKYGPNSTEAKEALDKLTIAQEALRVAQERADMSSRNYNNTMITAALTVIPSLISIIGTVSHAQEIWTGIQWALNAAMSANPIGIIILAIAGLVAIIVTAYETCKPFRDIINGIGEALSGFFLAAVNAVRGALEWLWNNVFVPFGNFLKAVFSPIISFLTELFNSFYSIIKPIVDAVTAVANIMGSFVNTIVGAMGGAANAIGGFISSVCFAHALQKAADESAGTMDNWQSMVKRNTDKALDSIKAFNAEVGISAVPSVSAVTAGAPLRLPAAKPTVSITITAPLVSIAGSADRATAQLAANMVREQLQNVIVQPTSSSNLVRKQMRIAR
jgi:phage-related protein